MITTRSQSDPSSNTGVIPTLSNTDPKVVQTPSTVDRMQPKQSSTSYRASAHKSSQGGSEVVGKPSGHLPAKTFVRESSISHANAHQPLRHSYPNIAQTWSNKYPHIHPTVLQPCPKAVQKISISHSKAVQQLSESHPGTI